jgi:hypothetical protein
MTHRASRNPIPVAMALLALALALAPPVLAQGSAATPPPTIVPPPPPPPVAPDTPAVKTAIDQARSCVTEPERSGFATRSIADDATRHLDAAPGTDTWNAARGVVSSYAKGRQAGMACLIDLKTLLFADPPGHEEQARLTSHDRAALRRDLDGLTNLWIVQGKWETVFLLRLVDPAAAQAEEMLAY